MQDKMKCLRSALLALLALCLAAMANAQTPMYDIVALGGSAAFALNQAGEVVGTYVGAGGQIRTFLYSNGQTTDLFPSLPPNGGDIRPAGINDRGQVAANGPNGSFVYDRNTGTSHSLGFNNSTTFNYAYGINQNGDIAGKYVPTSETQAFLYSSSTGTYQNLGDIPNGNGSVNAYAVNNRGQVVGAAGVGIGSHAFLYSNGVMQDIGIFPGGRFAEAMGINDNSDVVGYSTGTGNLYGHAFLYRNGQMQDLGTLFPNDLDSEAYGINNAGDIVGHSGGGAFLYHNGKMLNLNSLIDPSQGWRISDAIAINDAGQIIGSSNYGAFLMTPRVAATPAPGSLMVCGLGGGLLALRLRRRQ